MTEAPPASLPYAPLPYSPAPELSGGPVRRWPVVIVGGGPVGLAAAIDCGLHGIPALLLDKDDRVSDGSRAICWAKRTLEIFDRLGVARPVVDRGITWKLGKVFHGDQLIYSFDLLPEEGHKHPAFVNLQQYYVESDLVERARQMPGVETRWQSRVVGLSEDGEGVVLEVETPDGGYSVAADWVIACDGARSPLRDMLGLDFVGKVFQDRFLIADVKMTAAFPTERRFWFDPPFHPGGSALLHRQADDVWRIDLQLGWDADPEEERRPEKVIPRLKAMLGEDAKFELEWVSVYTFQCRRLKRFRYGRVVFAGDSAHQVSPFGARGGNGGVQDVDNLIWKLALVIGGDAPESLLDSYDEERVLAADENILNSTRSTDFITPKGPGAQALRDAVLSLAAEHDFARRTVNSGRLSIPAKLTGCGLQTPDDASWAGGVAPGAPCPDAPIEDALARPAWLLDRLGGAFVLMAREEDLAAGGVRDAFPGIRDLSVLGIAEAGEELRSDSAVTDVSGLVAERFALSPGSFYLVRPDQHVAARWRAFDAKKVRLALARAKGLDAAALREIAE